MNLKIGVDVGGTFTDFIVAGHGAGALIHKVLSTPKDPSIAVLAGLQEIAQRVQPRADFAEFIRAVDTIVHGTTVTTNATLTHTGARSALLTTKGVRDALEMRRGIRERQYDNHYTNVTPLVPRYLRHGVGGRLDRNGVRSCAARARRHPPGDRALPGGEGGGGVDLLHERLRQSGA